MYCSPYCCCTVDLPESVVHDPAMTLYASRCSREYLESDSPRRFLLEKRLYDDVLGTERTAVHIEPMDEDLSASWVTVASANETPERMLCSLVNYIRAKGFCISEVLADCIQAPVRVTEHDNGLVVVARVCIKVSGDQSVVVCSDPSHTVCFPFLCRTLLPLVML